MKNNENKNAMPMAYGENDFGTDGLTKLECAAIYIAASISSFESDLHSDHIARLAIATAKQIFKQLEDDNTAFVPDSEL